MRSVIAKLEEWAKNATPEIIRQAEGELVFEKDINIVGVCDKELQEIWAVGYLARNDYSDLIDKLDLVVKNESACCPRHVVSEAGKKKVDDLEISLSACQAKTDFLRDLFWMQVNDKFQIPVGKESIISSGWVIGWRDYVPETIAVKLGDLSGVKMALRDMIKSAIEGSPDDDDQPKMITSRHRRPGMHKKGEA